MKGFGCMVKGFKGMDFDMRCRGYEFSVGGVYEIENNKKLALCTDSGFHFCLKLDDVFNYYRYDDCRLFEVEAIGDVLTEGDKSVTKKLRIVRELTQDELNAYEFEDFRHDLWFKNRTDDELMVYKDSGDYETRMIVVQKLKDKELMFDTFKDDEDYGIRKAVIYRLDDQGLMFNTFKDDEDYDVRQTVVNCMDDLELMYDTFKDDEDWYVRRAVVNRMENLELMFNTFHDDESFFVREVVAKRVDDLSLMFNTFYDDRMWIVRLVVVERMEDKELMYNKFKNDESKIVRKTVKKRMGKPAWKNWFRI